MEVVRYKTEVGSGMVHLDLAFFAMLIILLNAYCCGAAVIVKSNSSFQCSGRQLDECLFEEDLALEFLMNPYISRMLGHGQSSTAHPSLTSLDEEKVITCGKTNDIRYKKCIPNGSAKGKNYHNCWKGNVYGGRLCSS